MNVYSIVLYLHIVGALLLFVAMVVMAALGAASNAARMPAIGRSIGPLRGPLPPEARAGLRDRIVWSSILTRIGIGLGIVLLMTAKPDLVGSIVTLVAFAAAGAAVAFATSGTAPGSTEPRGLERAS